MASINIGEFAAAAIYPIFSPQRSATIIIDEVTGLRFCVDLDTGETGWLDALGRQAHPEATSVEVPDSADAGKLISEYRVQRQPTLRELWAD